MKLAENKATLSFSNGSPSVDLPVYQGTVGPDVIDIRKLYGQTGMFTYDPGFLSTASCQSSIDRAQTRVFAFINIVGHGMGTASEDDPSDMLPEPVAEMARKNADVVVGFKTAHYSAKGWPAVEGAVKAGEMTHLPVMVDFGYIGTERSIGALFLEKLRPGDIYTHCYSGHRDELLNIGAPGAHLNPAMEAGRKRGIIFDVGHGGGSFYWNVAVPATKAGFWPDSAEMTVTGMSASSLLPPTEPILPAL